MAGDDYGPDWDFDDLADDPRQESWQGQLWHDVAWRDGDTTVEEARKLRLAGRAAEALELLSQDNEPRALLERGLALDDLGRLEDACDAYRRSAALDSDPCHALNHLGADLHALGQYAEAIEAFDAAASRPGGFLPATVNGILSHAELGAHDEAEQAFYLAQQTDERCPRSFFNLSRSLAMRGKWDRAAWCLRRVLEVDATPPVIAPCVVHFHLGEAEQRRGATAAARRHLGRCAALATVGDSILPEALAQLATLHLDAGDVPGAEPPVRRLLRIAPGRPAAQLLQGRVHLGRGELAAAGEALRRAAEADPTYPGVHLCLAELAKCSADPAEALRHLRAELLRCTGDPGTLEHIASLFTALCDPAGAAATWRKLIAGLPHHADAWRRLGAAECEAGRLREGIAASRQALRLTRDRDPAAWNNLALALAQVGDLRAARRAVGRGLVMTPGYLPLRRLRLRLRLAWLVRRFR